MFPTVRRAGMRTEGAGCLEDNKATILDVQNKKSIIPLNDHTLTLRAQRAEGIHLLR